MLIPITQTADLRHNYISHALNKEKIPVPIVAELVGHSDWRTTMRYTHPTRDELKESAEKMV